MSTPLLAVDDIDVYYGPIQALRGVSLEIREGERVALVGANGAGKTTTLRAISALVPVVEGQIRLEGEPLAGRTPAQVVEAGVAQLPEGRELFSGMSVEDNLRAGFWTLRKRGTSFKEMRDRVMDMFPILRERAHQESGTLSGGEQQMLGVARALMSNPRLIVVDELSMGLAPQIVSQLFDILREVNEQGTAVLIVEQFVHMALANTDRAYVLAKGEVVLDGRSADLLADPKLIASYLGEAADPAPEVAPARNGKGSGSGSKAGGKAKARPAGKKPGGAKAKSATPPGGTASGGRP